MLAKSIILIQNVLDSKADNNSNFFFEQVGVVYKGHNPFPH